MLRKLLNAVPLLIALALIAYACTRTSSQSPSSTVTSAAADFPIWQVKEGSVYDGDRVVKKLFAPCAAWLI